MRSYRPRPPHYGPCTSTEWSAVQGPASLLGMEVDVYPGISYWRQRFIYRGWFCLLADGYNAQGDTACLPVYYILNIYYRSISRRRVRSLPSLLVPASVDPHQIPTISARYLCKKKNRGVDYVWLTVGLLSDSYHSASSIT